MQIPGLAIREVPTISPADLLGKDKCNWLCSIQKMDLFDFSDGHVKQLEATVILEYYNNNNNSNNVYFIHPSGKLKLSFDLIH